MRKDVERDSLLVYTHSMGASITYMGTKRVLASAVSDVIRHSQPGTMLDAFSGMCSVGQAIGESRQIWNNDIQVFASEVARALFVSRVLPLSPLSCGDVHFEHFRSQRDLLSRCFEDSLAAEDDLTRVSSFSAFTTKMNKLQAALAKEIAKCRLRSPHLFATTYSGTFFGIRQAIEADAIVAALRSARSSRKICVDDFRWGTIALGRALLKVANSTGHFAQYLKPKEGSYRRYLALRRRSLWAEWLSSMSALSPVGDSDWRRQNRVFNQDSLTLIPRLARNGAEVSVIYADPPYTDDQYSRFYHVLETLCLYDYPEVTGAGLYRPARFQTPFSLKSKAAVALHKLVEVASRTGADLVLSYPTNGLANKANADIPGMLRKHFKRVEVSRSMPHKHSTFGASKGQAQAATTELIYLARSA
jgi:adenine-specific DNA-methyltransferase